MKLISIIIPVYNAEKSISKCLDSVLKQTYTNFEVLCIDDGSKDKSLNILKKYEKKDNRITVHHQKNMGVAKTRNKGITLAKGEYITFIDNDDYIEKDYLDNYVSKTNEEDYDIVIGGYKRVTDNKVLHQEVPNNTLWDKYVIVTPWAKLYKKETIQKCKAEFLDYGIAEDIYFLLNLYSHTLNIGYLKNRGYCWYFNQNSVSNTSQKGLNKSIDIIYVLKKFSNYRSNNKEKKYIEYFIYRYSIWYLLFSGSKANAETFYDEYKKIFSWLEKNKLDKVKIVKEDHLKYKLIIMTMKILKELNLIKIFSKLYCHSK